MQTAESEQRTNILGQHNFAGRVTAPQLYNVHSGTSCPQNTRTPFTAVCSRYDRVSVGMASCCGMDGQVFEHR